MTVKQFITLLLTVPLREIIMQIKYFHDTDTLLINFNNNMIFETKDINESILMELDENGNVVSMTLENAKSVVDINDFSYQQLAIA